MGAFSVYQLIMNRIKEDIPTIDSPLKLSDFEIEKVTEYKGDLTILMDIQDVFSRETFLFHPKWKEKNTVLKMGDFMEDEINFVYYENKHKNKPRLLLYRDSYSEHLRPFLSEHFSYSAVVWSRNLNKKRIEKENPDIIIHEILERFLDNLLLEPQ
jgi:hypothetical protein